MKAQANYPSKAGDRQQHSRSRSAEANARYRARQRGDAIQPNSPEDIARWWKERGR